MSIQQQINQYNVVIAQKQEQRDAQARTLGAQQLQLVQDEQFLNDLARLALDLTRPDTAQLAAEEIPVQRQVVADAKTAIARTQNNIRVLDEAIAFNTSSRDQIAAANPAQGAPTSTAGDAAANATANAALNAPEPTPVAAAPAPVPVAAVPIIAAPVVTTAAPAPVTDDDATPFVAVPAPVLAAEATPSVAVAPFPSPVTTTPSPVSVYSAVLNDGQAPGQIGTYFVQGPDGTVIEGTPGSTLDQAREEASRLTARSVAVPDPATFTPAPVDSGAASAAVTPNSGPNAAPEQVDAANQQALQQQLQLQAAIADQRRQINQGDWRVRLSLAPNSTYLYNDPDPGILAPLSSQGGSDGVIFPYTPKIDLSYRAEYSTIALTHSNYKGYFYQSSMLDPVNLTCTFTAQDTNEANYLLAVIHFFRSVTKMFYGQDPQRGAPPPLVYLKGLGEYQFAEHPCLVTQFNYSLPSDVDYIRARSLNVNGTNILARRKYNPPVATNVFTSVLTRLSTLANQNIQQGAEPSLTTPAPPTLGADSPTYVPTKLDLSLILLPVQSRQQISQQFSLKKFSNGDLLKKGFW